MNASPTRTPKSPSSMRYPTYHRSDLAKMRKHCAARPWAVPDLPIYLFASVVAVNCVLSAAVGRRAKNLEIDAFHPRRHVMHLRSSSSATTLATTRMCFRKAWPHCQKTADVVPIVAPPSPPARSGPQCAAHSQPFGAHTASSKLLPADLCPLRSCFRLFCERSQCHSLYVPESPCWCIVVADHSRALSPRGR